MNLRDLIYSQEATQTLITSKIQGVSRNVSFNDSQLETVFKKEDDDNDDSDQQSVDNNPIKEEESISAEEISTNYKRFLSN
jgi:hypothetical protein